MAEIAGFLSRDGTVKGTCCWCGTSSTSSGIAPGMGGVEMPLHLLCAVRLVRAWSRWIEHGINAAPGDLLELSEYASRVRLLTDPGGGGET